MQRIPAYLLIAAVVPMLMAADYAPPTLVTPKDSSLRLVHNEDDDAQFTGQIWVSGVVTAQQANVVDDEVGEPELVLVPDDASMKLLPYFSGYEVKGITLTNYKAAVVMVFGKDRARKMMKRVDGQKMEGRFLIEGYDIGIECDYPYANARLVSADVPPKVASIGDRVDAHCG